MAYINTGAYDKWRRQQEEQALTDKYNAEKAALDARSQNSGGLGGFLGGIIGGIGKGISDVGNGVIDMLGSGVASARDLGSLIATGQLGNEEEKWLKYRRGTDDIKDARLKTAGQALNAATTLATTAAPGLAGSGTALGKFASGTLANTVGGGVSGIADELQQEGVNANYDNAMKRAATGMITGAATGALGNKIGNAKSAVGKALLNNKAVTSTIGRGALSGAVGGATGAGISAGLEGQDVLSAAVEGAKSGAISGGVQAGLTSAAKSIGTSIRDNAWGKLQDRNTAKVTNTPEMTQDTGNTSTVDEYGMWHRPTKTGVLANDLNNSAGRTDLEVWGPNDVYDNPQYYATAGSKEANLETSNIIKNLKGASPDQEVTIYRATPGNSINDGDWVTFSKQYATDHNNSQLDGKGNVVEMKVPLKDVQWAGDDLNEWGYFPQQKKIYHGTTATFEDFDENNPSTWFSSSDKNLKDTGLRYDGTRELNVMERELPSGIKLADENMADNLTKQQLIDRGYEGIYYTERGPNGDETYYEIFKPNKSLKKTQPKTAEPIVQPTVEAPTTYREPVLPDYTTPIDYQGNELKIRNKNILEKAGGILSDAGESIRNREVYNSLYSKTANRVTRNGSIDKLRELGFEPSDYGEAAKISTTTNKFVDDIVKNSGATVTDQAFAERILTPDDNIIISDPTYQKKYDTQVKNLLGRIETGNRPGEYAAADLLSESRRFGDLANDLRKKSTNVNGDVTNRDGYELAAAYTDVKYALRDLASTAVDGFGDNYTKQQLGARLKKLGAPQAAIDYILDADDIGGFIRNTSTFEDARQMDREIKETSLRRNANAGKSTNPLTVALNSAGVPQLLESALSPVGKFAGGIARTVGDVTQQIGARLPEGGKANLTPTQQLLLGNFIGRTEGNKQGGQITRDTQLKREYNNLEQMLVDAQAAQMPTTAIQPSANAIKLQSQIGQLSNMMEQALAMGDIASYNKMQTVYNQLYNAYKNEMPETDSNSLTVSQKNKLAKLQNATDALDQLEQLYSNAGGAQGIGGNLSNWLSNVGMNNNLSEYNQSAKTLLNQISSAVGSTVSPDLIPRSTDSKEEAQAKIETLKKLIQQASGNYATVYQM